jgi:hypothetical protein
MDGGEREERENLKRGKKALEAKGLSTLKKDWGKNWVKYE